MLLYDGISSINWKTGELTREEMDGNYHYPQRDVPSVLFDDGNGLIYDWRFLSVLCSQYGIEFTENLDDYQSTFEAVLYASKNQSPKPTIESVNTKATEAKSTADLIQTQINALTSAFEVSEVTDDNAE